MGIDVIPVGTQVTINDLSNYRSEITPTLPCVGTIRYAFLFPEQRYHVEVADGRQFDVSCDQISEIV